MAEDLSPNDIRIRKFTGARRGYDRDEVTRFLSQVADRFEEIETELASLQAGLHQLGITRLPDLKAEIEDIGVEIQGVLDSALAAAEGMRTRATADAATKAREADRASQELLGDAWSTGTELLEQASQEADRLVREAGEDALFIRAEAEQDAKRLVSDARRQADDTVRASREEGERIVVIAKAESEAILEGARQSAEQAQQRARALENRRSELLNELEAAESAMRDIEAGRAQRDPGDGTVRVIGGRSEDRTHWPDDDGTVRVLPSDTALPVEPEPVDAEEVAAEVERMRSAVARRQVDENGSPGEAAADRPEKGEPAAAEDADRSDESEGPEAEIATPEIATDTVTTPEPGDAVAASPEPPRPSDEVVSRPVVTSEDDAIAMQGDPAIDDLFAKLRRSVAEVAEPQPETEPLGEPISREEELPSPPDLTVVEPPPVSNHFEMRDRVLLPIENQALRGLKRRIVELQNSVLEGLRRSPGDWRLGRDQVVSIMGDELDAVLQDSFKAGLAAAAAEADKPEPQITGGPQQGAAELFTADLHDDVQSVLERGEVGSRRLSAEVGRVFRSWRTDEAERHVRRAARRAYNDGLLAAYARLGIEAVRVVAPGRPCGRCSAGSGLSWDPKEAPPEGTTIPPAGPSCEAMIAPAAGDGSHSGSGQ